jgi:hypothetical protein
LPKAEITGGVTLARSNVSPSRSTIDASTTMRPTRLETLERR